MAERTCKVEGCDKTTGHGGRGYCSTHYTRWRRHGDPLRVVKPQDRRPPPFVDDFWDRVEKTHEHGCWLWVGRKDPKGYGEWVGARPARSRDAMEPKAHRESWRRVIGPVPKSKHVLHICDQPSCVNPKHLYLGTNKENLIDRRVRTYSTGSFAIGGGAVKREFCNRGHPMSGDNLYVQPSNGHRFCRECKRVRRRLNWKAPRPRGRTDVATEKIVELRDEAQMSWSQVAAAVGMSTGGVRSRYLNAS